MSKKNILNWSDLGLLIEEVEGAPSPEETTLTNIPASSGTDTALSLIDGGDDTPGVDWSPEMQDQPEDAPEDREAQTMKKEGSGITAKKSSGGQQSGGQQSGGQQSGGQDDGKPAFLKKKAEESYKLTWADLGLVEDQSNPFEKDDDDGDQGDQKGGQQSGGQQSGGQQSGGQKGQQGGQKGGQQSGGQQADSKKEVDECSGGETRLMDHNMGSGEIAVDQELMKMIIRAAAADQPSDDQIDIIVQAIAGCCGEDRTLTSADSGMIEDKLRELAGGQQGAQGGQQRGQQAPMGDQGTDPIEADAIPPGDGEMAGPEGGQQHEGKTKLMSGLGESKKPAAKRGKMKVNEAWVMGIPGVGVQACIGEAGDEEIDEETIQLRRMARAAGNPEWFNVGRK